MDAVILVDWGWDAKGEKDRQVRQIFGEGEIIKKG